jgi:hypothetical protein
VVCESEGYSELFYFRFSISFYDIEVTTAVNVSA